MTYSSDFRERALKIKEKENLTILEAAIRFGIGASTMKRWMKNSEIKKTRNRNPRKILTEALMEDVKQYPDAYLWERAERFNVTDMGIYHALKRLNLTRKKRRSSTLKQGMKNEKTIKKP